MFNRPCLKVSQAAVLVLASLILFELNSAQSPGVKPTAAQWQADLKFMAERMQLQHPNLFRRVAKADFDSAVKALNDRIPTASEDEIVVGFMQIVAMVKDGHSGIFPRPHFRSGVFPVRFYWFDDGLFVQRAAPQYANLAGAKVVKIAGLPVDEVLRKISTVFGADNEMGVRENAPLFLSIPELLRGLRIIKPEENLKLTVEIGGKETSVELKPAFSVDQLLNPPADWIDFASKQPLYLKHGMDNYWFEYLADEKIMYVQENAVQNKQDESLARFYGRVMEFVAANPVEKLVIDVRRNDGGNNGLNRPVVIGLIKSKMDVPGKLFVITGRATFSAAQNFVNELEKYTNAIFVGEPTAGRPNHYGDGRQIVLPNSGMHVQASTLYWQDMDPRDNRPWTAPSIAAALTSTDYRNGVDPALRAVIEYRPGVDLQSLLDSAAKEKDIAAFVRQYESFRADPKHRFVEAEAPINRLGYNLLQTGRTADAVEVFKLNVRSYPNSVNVYDSLGDAYQAAGNKAEAIKAYEKALSIDPNFPSSLEALRKLKSN